MVRDPANPVLFDEERRLAALYALNLLDTHAEAEYDAIVALAARLLDMPAAHLSLVDRARVWLKARVNLDVQEAPRAISFCDHAVRGYDELVVNDATLDPRFRDSPFVASDDGIRFYAGMPIRAPDAQGVLQPIGTLCVLDFKPGILTEEGRASLHHLALLAEALISARAAACLAVEVAALADDQAAALDRQDRTFRQAERMTGIGSWRFVPGDDGLEWSDSVFGIYDLPTGQRLSLPAAIDFYAPHDRQKVRQAIGAAIESGRAFDLELDFVTAKGRPRRMRCIGEPEVTNGRVTSVVGALQDITDRHVLEQSLRHSADTDALTGIANRAAFDRTLKRAMEAARENDTPLHLALIDLDGFKTINDTLGHNAGDDVLRSVGRTLQADWLLGSFVARLGGDEFAVIVEAPDLDADIAALAERLDEELRMLVGNGSITLASAGTVGIATLEPSFVTVRDFVHCADTVLYTAKRARIGERRIGARAAASR